MHILIKGHIDKLNHKAVDIKVREVRINVTKYNIYVKKIPNGH